MAIKSNRQLFLKLTDNSTAQDINIVLAILNLVQDDLAEAFNVKQASISYAVNNTPGMGILRSRLIQYLNSLQANKTNSLKTTKTKEVT